MTLSESHQAALLELSNGPTTAAAYGAKIGSNPKKVYHHLMKLVGDGLASRAYAPNSGHIEYVYRITESGKRHLAGEPVEAETSEIAGWPWKYNGIVYQGATHG